MTDQIRKLRGSGGRDRSVIDPEIFRRKTTQILYQEKDSDVSNLLIFVFASCNLWSRRSLLQKLKTAKRTSCDSLRRLSQEQLQRNRTYFHIFSEKNNSINNGRLVSYQQCRRLRGKGGALLTLIYISQIFATPTPSHSYLTNLCHSHPFAFATSS